jgi:hypothetical protein
MIIKIQVPCISMPSMSPVLAKSGIIPIGMATFIIYDKKKEFKCTVHRKNCPSAYDKIDRMVKEKGINGGKGYFMAEWKSKEELVVKVSELLAEQPF